MGARRGHPVAVRPQRTSAGRSEPASQQAWTLIALLALGALFWLPRFQERLPGGPAPCPTAAPEAPPPDPAAAPEPGRAARLAGALGEAQVSILPGGALVERHEAPEVRWVLCPLAIVVGLSLAGLALGRMRERLRRPKAALMYAISACLGLGLSAASLRAATYSQTLRLSSGTLEFDTSELLGLHKTRRKMTGLARISAWRSTGRWSLYAVPVRPDPKGCASILHARWIEPDLLAVLNRALR